MVVVRFILGVLFSIFDGVFLLLKSVLTHPVLWVIGLSTALLTLALISKVPLRYNVRNLVVRWKTTIMTALAFTFVTGLLTVMLAFVNGMNRLTQASGHGENVIVLSDGATDEAFSNLAFTDTCNIDNLLDAANRARLERDANGRALCSREKYVVVGQPRAPPLPRKEWPGAAQIQGKILQLKPDAGSLQILGSDGGLRAFRLTPSTKVTINDERRDLHQFRKSDEVAVSYTADGETLTALEIWKSSKRRFLQVRGIEEVAKAVQVHRLELLPGGEWFTTAGVRPLPGAAGRSAARQAVEALSFATGRAFHVPVVPPGEEMQAIEAVLGEGVARELNRDPAKQRLEVGDVFELGARKAVVVGIMKSSGNTFGSEVWADSQLVGDMFTRPAFNSMVVRTRGAADADAVAEALRNKDITRGAQFASFTETDYYSKLSTTNQQFLGAIVIVAVIVGIGGIFGVMNTMFAAISERTKDIGVLGILGFSRGQILVSFFLEALVLALVGGALGCAIGSLANGLTATSIVSSGQGGGKSVVFELVVDANTIAVGLLFTLIMGILGGLLPARSAMRLWPLESLR